MTANLTNSFTDEDWAEFYAISNNRFSWPATTSTSSPGIALWDRLLRSRT